MLGKIYLEITNVCNLDCSFCHKTSRKKKFLSEEEFEVLTDKLSGKAKYLYFHLMGEPTLHPHLPKFISRAKEKGFCPMLTTNGSLLQEKGSVLLESLPHKISISLHAPEANPTFSAEGYLDGCISFAREAAKKGCFIALRLWNLGSDADNSEILDRLHKEFPNEWVPIRGGISERLDTGIFLEWGERFDWPDATDTELESSEEVFCYALRNQVGVLVDGTVVPCCLDADGSLALGDLFSNELDEILSGARARAMFNAFSCRKASEDMCKRCGFAKKFSKNI